MAINDVLPLKAARRDAIANLKCFWGLRHQKPNFDGYIYIHYAAPPYSARMSAISFLFPSVWQRFVGFGFRMKRVRSTIQNLRRVGENSDPILSRCGPKFTKFSDNVGSPLYFPTPFSDCLYRVSFRRHSPLSLEVVEKPSKCKSLLDPNFCRRDGSDFSTAVC